MNQHQPLDPAIGFMMTIMDRFIECLDHEMDFLRKRELDGLKESNKKKGELSLLYSQASSALLKKLEGKILPHQENNGKISKQTVMQSLKEKSPQVLQLLQDKNQALHQKLIENESVLNKVHRGHEQLMSIVLQAVKIAQKTTNRYTASGVKRSSSYSSSVTLNRML